MLHKDDAKWHQVVLPKADELNRSAGCRLQTPSGVRRSRKQHKFRIGSKAAVILSQGDRCLVEPFSLNIARQSPSY